MEDNRFDPQEEPQYSFVYTAAVPQERGETEEAPPPRPRKKLRGDGFVLVAQVVLCLILIGGVLVFRLIGGEAFESFSTRYHEIVREEFDLFALFEPIKQEGDSAASGQSSSPEGASSLAGGSPSSEEPGETPSQEGSSIPAAESGNEGGTAP